MRYHEVLKSARAEYIAVGSCHWVRLNAAARREQAPGLHSAISAFLEQGSMITEVPRRLNKRLMQHHCIEVFVCDADARRPRLI